MTEKLTETVDFEGALNGVGGSEGEKHGGGEVEGNSGTEGNYEADKMATAGDREMLMFGVIEKVIVEEQNTMTVGVRKKSTIGFFNTMTVWSKGDGDGPGEADGDGPGRCRWRRSRVREMAKVRGESPG